VRYIVPFRQLDMDTIPEVGGQNASLDELLRFARFLADQGIDSISVTPDALPAVVRILATP